MMKIGRLLDKRTAVRCQHVLTVAFFSLGTTQLRLRLMVVNRSKFDSSKQQARVPAGSDGGFE
jgi:hypothetical protein